MCNIMSIDCTLYMTVDTLYLVSVDTCVTCAFTSFTGLEVLCEQRKDEIERREKQVKSLQTKLIAMTTTHKREKEELEKHLKQKIYLANVRGKRFNQSSN